MAIDYDKLVYCDDCEKAMECNKWKVDERICGCCEGKEIEERE